MQRIEGDNPNSAVQIHISSDWLRRHIIERGGTMNIATRLVISG